MLSMFLNRKDADARSEDLTQATIRLMNEGHKRQMAHIQRMGSLDNAQRIIRKQQEKLEVLNVECNATIRVLKDLVDWNDPKVRSKIRMMRSRHLDNELNAAISEGAIAEDPRHDTKWVKDNNYIP